MRKVYTVDDIRTMTAADVLTLPAGVFLTPAAWDLARERGIQIRESVDQVRQSKLELTDQEHTLLRQLVSERLGGHASNQDVEEGMKQVLDMLRTTISEPGQKSPLRREQSSRHVQSRQTRPDPLRPGKTQPSQLIISVVGIQKSEIVSAITNELTELHCIISYLHQHLADEYLFLNIIVELPSGLRSIAEISARLEAKANQCSGQVVVLNHRSQP